MDPSRPLDSGNLVTPRGDLQWEWGEGGRGVELAGKRDPWLPGAPAGWGLRSLCSPLPLRACGLPRHSGLIWSQSHGLGSWKGPWRVIWPSSRSLTTDASEVVTSAAHTQLCPQFLAVPGSQTLSGWDRQFFTPLPGWPLLCLPSSAPYPLYIPFPPPVPPAPSSHNPPQSL